MIRGQLCLYVQGPDESGWAAAGGVGIIEAPIGDLKPERVLSYVGTDTGRAHMLWLGDYAEPPVDNHGEEMADHVRSSIWSRPLPGSGTPGGGMLFRRTRVPALPGHEIMTIAVCMYAPAGALASQELYSLTARGGGTPDVMVLHDPVPSPQLAENGIGMAQLLKRPAWGWEDKFALQSTMRLEVIDQAREIRVLTDMDARSEIQEARLLALRNTPGWWAVHPRGKDPAFDEFRRRMGEEHPFDDWSKPVSEEQLSRRKTRAASIIRELDAQI